MIALSSGRGGARSESRPGGSDVSRELQRLMVTWVNKSKHVAALLHRDLGNDVRRRAESIDAQPRARPRHPIGTVTNQPGTQERRGVHIVVLVWKWEAKGGIGNRVFGVPAIDLIAGVARVRAEIFAIGAAIVHMPQDHPSHGMPMRVPGTRVVTSRPTASTRPTISCPGTMGIVGFGNSPSTTWRSVRHTPHASTLTSTRWVRVQVDRSRPIRGGRGQPGQPHGSHRILRSLRNFLAHLIELDLRL